MKPITYLCFTLLSLIIQFCLMNFINGQIKVDDSKIDTNKPIAKNLSNIFHSIKQKPHALFYRTENNKIQVKSKSQIRYDNDSLIESPLTSSTELASTVFELLYDENESVTDSDSVTETLFTMSSTEFDNVTEMTFFDKIPSTIRPTVTPEKKSTNKCYCNLLYKACDINCCCDNDCSDEDKSLLKNCEDSGKGECEIRNIDYLHMCSSQFTCNEQLQSDAFGYLFCIGKANLPENGKSSKTTLYALDADNRLKWHVTKKKSKNIMFTKNLYSLGQPIWMVANDSIDYLELPITVTNEYCNGYKAIEFQRNDYVKCYVKLKDLHMLDVIKSVGRAKISSPIEITLNSTKMDCTTLHCINWTLLSCDELKCTKYNKELHEPTCSESHCNNIAVKIEYEFYCNVSLITRVIVKFHVRTISMAQEYALQEIAVNFYLGNHSIENVVKFSGNPGYIRGLPIIISLSESNHTEKFFNSSVARSNYLLMPYNRDGGCVVTNLTHNIVMFGHNKQLKCRAYFRQNFTTYNGTERCQKIQARIDELFGLGPNILIAPYGNPQDVTDKNWVRLETFNKSNIYGEYHPKDSKLLCFNLITRIAFIIAFADTNDANKQVNKIISARVDSTTKNKTFSIDDLSTVITIDTNFIDVSKQTFHEYIEVHFDFHLPKDFFFPLASNKGSLMKLQIIILFLCSVIMYYK